MTIQLTADGLRKIFPRAPQAVLDAFLAKQGELTKTGVNHTRTRLAYFLANIEHETDGFTIKNLTENINYTPVRAAQIWPSRFRSASDVVRMFGTQPGWQLSMFDNVYGNRMGNRPGTYDGSRYIGRGGPQWTGREGYVELQRRTGLPAVDKPEVAALPAMQPEVCVAFWAWKNLNPLADAGNFSGVVKRWNGGQIGIEDRRARLAGNDRPIEALPDVDQIKVVTKTLPGKPPTKAPPDDVVDAATKKERTATKVGAGVGIGGGAAEGTSQGTQQPDQPAMISPFITWTLIGAGIGVVVVAAVLLAKKKAAIIANWN